jgi:ankyrin repeat protein
MDVNRPDDTFEAGAIRTAATKGHLDILEFLMSNGADLDVSDSVRNPLFAAIYGGHKNIARALLDAGIDARVSYTGDYMTNMDAVAFAEENGQREIAKMIREHLAKTKEK